MNFGNRLKIIRQNNSLTQEELAKKINTSRSNIANYENDKNMPSIDILVKLANIFDCSIDYLIGNDTKSNIEHKNTLEKELFDLDLTEEEFNQIINNVTKNNNYISTLYKGQDKISKGTRICLFHEWNFTPGITEDLTYEQLLTLNQEDKKQYLQIQKIFLELDKNKIIHNYNKLYNIPIIGKIAAGQPILAQENIEGYLPVDPNIYGMTSSEDYFFLRVSGNSMNQKVKNGDYALIHKQDYAENGDIIVAIVNGDDEATLKKYKKINDDLIALEPQSDDDSYETIYIDKNTNFQIIGKAIGQFGKF